jgi:hypothetical protein
MPGGRPSALTLEKQEALLQAIRSGASDKRAAFYAGIHVDTVRQWRRKGEAALAKPARERGATERKYGEFVTQLERALNETSVLMAQVLTANARLGVQHRRQDGSMHEPNIDDRRLAVDVAKFWTTHRERDTYHTRHEVVTDTEQVPEGFDVLERFRVLAKANPEDDEPAEQQAVILALPAAPPA